MLKNSQNNETCSDNEIHSDAIFLPNDEASIAELAYYKSENRGFEPGHEIEDWLAAERAFYSRSEIIYD